MLFPVEYQPNIPERGLAKADRQNNIRRKVLTKSDKWSFEREWRIIGDVPESEAGTAELFASYHPDALSGVIFGVRTSHLHKTLIRTLLQDRHVTFLQATQQEDDFALQIEEAKFERPH